MGNHSPDSTLSPAEFVNSAIQRAREAVSFYTQDVTIVIERGFQLGDWQVFPEQGTLLGDNGAVHIEPKIMDVLVYLATHQGEVVKRNELIDEVWKGTMVTDEVLSRAVSVLRMRLGDDRMTPIYIQTLPKTGYRLLMPIGELPADGPSPKPVDVLRTRWPLLLAALVVLMGVSWFLIREDVVIDPRSPAAFADIMDWFDFLLEEKEGTAGITSIAVLPFENLTEGIIDQTLGDGLTDELTMSLSKVKGLRVVARRSSYSFRNRSDDVPTIGRLLNVDAVFEGTVRQTGDQVRINALLSNAGDGYLIWSDLFECGADELYTIQESMANAVVAALKEHFVGGSLEVPAAQQTPPDIEAYQLYLMAPNFLWQMRGERPLRKSIEMYRKALAIDPEFSRAKIGLANSLVLLPFYSNEPMEPLFREAEQVLGERSFANQRDLGEAESIYAFIAFHRWNWIEAEERFRRALELAPDSPNIYQWYSQHLGYVGRKHDGLAAARRARDLDEVSPVINDRLAVAYLWLNDDMRAAEHFAISAQLGFRNAINPGYMVLLIRAGRFEQFKSVMTAYHHGHPDIPHWLIDNAETVFDPRNRKKAIAMASQAEKQGHLIRPGLQFGLWVILGANENAFRAFEELRDHSRQFLQLEFIWAEEGRRFREDSRFDDFARDIGWSEYWDLYGEPDRE